VGPRLKASGGGIVVLATVMAAIILAGGPGTGGGGVDTYNLAVLEGTNGVSCDTTPTRESTPVAAGDVPLGATACTFNQAWQAASQTAHDRIIVKADTYSTQSLLTRSNQPTCDERGANGTGVQFVMASGVAVNGIVVGDEATFGAGNQTVQCVTFTADDEHTWESTGTINISNATDATLEDMVIDHEFAEDKAVFWRGRTNRTTLRRVDLCCVTDEKMMESIITSSTASATTTIEDNSDIWLVDSVFHEMRRTGSGVHNECFLAPAVPGLRIERTHWYGCTVMNLNVGAYDAGGVTMTDVPNHNFYWANNIFESPTDLDETVGDKNFGPFFQGCAEPDWALKTGWVVEYNIIESGWYSGGGTGCGDTGLIFRGNITRVNAVCPGGTRTYSVFAMTCSGTGNQNIASGTIFSGTNFTSIAGHDWTYPPGAAWIDDGDTGNYPALDFTGAARYLGAGPDVGPYEDG
jgi:hypothetical protein